MRCLIGRPAAFSRAARAAPLGPALGLGALTAEVWAAAWWLVLLEPQPAMASTRAAARAATAIRYLSAALLGTECLSLSARIPLARRAVARLDDPISRSPL